MISARLLAGLGRVALTAAAGWAAAIGAAMAVELTILAPKETPARVTREVVHVLGRTEVGARVRVDGVDVPVYATGVFVRDGVPLRPGLNRLVVEALQADGRRLTRTVEVERVAPPPPPPGPPTDRIAFDMASVQPRELLRVAEDEPVEVRFSATPGLRAEVRRAPSPNWQPLDEVGPGRYAGWLTLQGPRDLEPQPLELRLSAPRGAKLKGPTRVVTRTPGAVGLWRRDVVRLAVTGADGAALLHGLHTVRLGGPFLTELPAGVPLRLTGQRGDHLRVRLAADTQAWMAERAIGPAEPRARPARGFFTRLNVTAEDDADVVTIPLAAPLPWAVQAITPPGGRAVLQMDLFGAHHATTWITHAMHRRAVHAVRVEQAAPDRVRLHVELNSAQAWGWRVEHEPAALKLRVRHAPPPVSPGALPLQGLRVAVEAGHGSAANLGAVGATGVPEKDVNRWTADALRDELQAAGAEVVDVRPGDENPTLRERARRVVDSGAHLFVSMHANAAEPVQGYLRAAGTGTFYKHANAHDLADAVQRRLLQAGGLPDLGLVGNFNYAPIRSATWVPSLLVEQAFLSNPAEEAQLLDPAFRQRLARAVREGLEDALRPWRGSEPPPR